MEFGIQKIVVNVEEFRNICNDRIKLHACSLSTPLKNDRDRQKANKGDSCFSLLLLFHLYFSISNIKIIILLLIKIEHSKSFEP